jgi:chemotaxis protein MotB
MSARAAQGNISRDRWLVSYADFITLLFAFFVVLYAFAKADQKKQAQVPRPSTRLPLPGHLSDARRKPAAPPTPPRGIKAACPMNIVMGEDVLAPARVKDDLEHIRRELEQKLSNQVARTPSPSRWAATGWSSACARPASSSPARPLPKPETLPTLRQIAASLGRTPYDLRIEGHTDNIPIHTANSTPTGSSPRPAPRASPASSST